MKVYIPVFFEVYGKKFK